MPFLPASAMTSPESPAAGRWPPLCATAANTAALGPAVAGIARRHGRRYDGGVQVNPAIARIDAATQQNAARGEETVAPRVAFAAPA